MWQNGLFVLGALGAPTWVRVITANRVMTVGY